MADHEELNKDEVSHVAGVVSIVLGIVDQMDEAFDLDIATGALRCMKRDISLKEALPFPATLNKADELRLQADVMEAVVNLFRARREQKSQSGKKRFIDDEALARMGLV
ncbi:MAG TPA: hypothetical protein VMW87_06190 [Spirochaetia bacterium]|nr:hypothetical protein [Spirochaetia bacterium]